MILINSNKSSLYNHKRAIFLISRILQSLSWRANWLYDFIFNHIPYNSLGDNVFLLFKFLEIHKRLPSDQLIFNDYLYQNKVNGELTNPLRVFVTDKEFVKIFIRAMIGEEYTVPTISILRTPEEAMNYRYPTQCCIKPTHLAGGKCILRIDNEPIDFQKIQSWFSKSHYHSSRGANYKTLKPKVIIEPIIFNDTNINDYKIFCYQGKAKLIEVDKDRFIEHKRNFYSNTWQIMPFSFAYPNFEGIITKPKNLDQMLEIASKLAINFEFISVDLYTNGSSIFVGELTNCPGDGEGIFLPNGSEEEVSKIIFSI